MSITINGNGTITGYDPVPNGSITAAKLASGAITASTLPANSLVKFANYTNANKSDVTSDTTWTKLNNTEVTFTPTFSNSKLEVMWIYSLMSNGAATYGIGIQIWKEVSGTHTQLDEQYQYIHFSGSGWDGPGAVTTAYVDTISSTADTSYYLKFYKEGGSNLSLNYGQDASGMTCIIKEIKQ